MSGSSMAAALDSYPARLTEAMCREIAGPLFDEDLFHALCFGEERVSKNVFLSALDERTDVFLTHDWGVENGVDNHARVAMVNQALKKKGLLTWFDAEKMKGNVKHQMSSGIDHAQCVVVFITQRYISKVIGHNAEDNCLLEFDYSARRKTGKKMIPVVMEEAMRNTRKWRGAVGMVLGGRLYTDMSQSFDDPVYFERCIDDLYDKIIEVVGKPVKCMSLSTVNLSSFRELSPREEGYESSYTKPLLALTINEVGCLLDQLNLGMYKSIFRQNMVDGPTLDSCECIEHVKELGATITAKAKILFDKLLRYQQDGVPVDMIACRRDDAELAESKGDPPSRSPSKMINLSKKSASKAASNRSIQSTEDDYADKADVLVHSEGKSSFQRYEEEADGYYDEDYAAPEADDAWTCLSCGKDNYDGDLDYCVFCATIRGFSGQRGRNTTIPLRR